MIITAAQALARHLKAVTPAAGEALGLGGALWRTIGVGKISPTGDFIEQHRAAKRMKHDEGMQGAMTQAVQPKSMEILKPTVWTQGLKEGMVVKIHHELRKEAPALKRRFEDDTLAKIPNKFGETELATGGVVKVEVAAKPYITEIELAQASEFGESMSVRRVTDELLVDEIPKANATKSLLELAPRLAGSEAGGNGEWICEVPGSTGLCFRAVGCTAERVEDFRRERSARQAPEADHSDCTGAKLPKGVGCPGRWRRY